MHIKKAMYMILCAVMLMSLIGCRGEDVSVIGPTPQPTPMLTEEADAEEKASEDAAGSEEYVPVKREPQLVDLDSEEAVTAVLAEGTIELAKKLPEAKWNSLPTWNGVTVPNMQQYDWLVCEQPQEFSREDIENIAALGFNFVRVPLDARLYLDMDDPSKVRLDRLLNLDDLVSWCAEFGIHICPDMHFGFGFTTDGDSSNDTLWGNPEEQELFIAFWDILANRYKDVPNNLMSFNLINEPDKSVSEECYVDLMRKAMDAIRKYTPDRLIFVDMLETASKPIYSMVDDKVAQSFHFYEPHAFTAGKGSWPMYCCKGAIMNKEEGSNLSFTGDFSAGTKLCFHVNSIHLSGTLVVEADGESIYEWEFGKDEVGENDCISISEEGTDGEYSDYDIVHEVTLPSDASHIYVYTKGDSYWFGLGSLKLVTEDKTYCFQPVDDPSLLPDGKNSDDVPNPNITINDDGSVEDNGDIFFSLVDKNYINSRFEEYKAFSEETGVEVMMQEFGVWYEADYTDTLIYFDDLLSAANENGLNWCGWDYFGVYSFYTVNDYEMRSGATYKPFSNGFMATELYDVFKSNIVWEK